MVIHTGEYHYEMRENLFLTNGRTSCQSSEHHVIVIGTQSTRIIDKEIILVKNILICDVCVTNKT